MPDFQPLIVSQHPVPPDSSTEQTPPLLALRGFSVDFDTAQGLLRAVQSIDLSVGRGECLGLVGESGSGKTQTVLSALGLAASNARLSGSVRFDDRELVGLKRVEIDRLRGRKIGFVFQNPMTALTPHLMVGTQLTEGLQIHLGLGHKRAVESAVSMLSRVGISEPGRRMRSYPHEFSGGMKQRLMIAIALLCEPSLLIADEPTTALDATVQAQILDLIDDLRREQGLSVLFISHNLGAVARLCDRVSVMYAGRIVETASVRELFASPHHPYTRALMASVPRLSDKAPARPIPGEPPAISSISPGCAFAPRCSHQVEACQTQPAMLSLPNGGNVACHCQVA